MPYTYCSHEDTKPTTDRELWNYDSAWASCVVLCVRVCPLPQPQPEPRPANRQPSTSFACRSLVIAMRCAALRVRVFTCMIDVSSTDRARVYKWLQTWQLWMYIAQNALCALVHTARFRMHSWMLSPEHSLHRTYAYFACTLHERVEVFAANASQIPYPQTVTNMLGVGVVVVVAFTDIP